MTDCKHNRKIGDNYGISCQNCGKQLVGFGYGGWFGKNINTATGCIHHFMPMGDREVCTYCEAERKPEQKWTAEEILRREG